MTYDMAVRVSECSGANFRITPTLRSAFPMVDPGPAVAAAAAAAAEAAEAAIALAASLDLLCAAVEFDLYLPKIGIRRYLVSGAPILRMRAGVYSGGSKANVFGVDEFMRWARSILYSAVCARVEPKGEVCPPRLLSAAP
jgi:hypothetical protein